MSLWSSWKASLRRVLNRPLSLGPLADPGEAQGALHVFETRFRFPHLGWVQLPVLGLIIALTWSHGSQWLAMLAYAGSTLLFDRALNRGTLMVGDDGVQLTRWLYSRSRFVSYEAIMRVRVDRRLGRLVLELRSGDRVCIYVTDPESVATQLYDRIDRGLGRDAIAPLLLFNRELGTPSDWLNGVRRRLTGHYRESAPTPELLLRVAEDLASAPEERVAASLALENAPAALRTRVRIAAESTAQSDVREAMLQAVDGELDEELLKGMNATAWPSGR